MEKTAVVGSDITADEIEQKYFHKTLDNWEGLGLRESVVKELKYVMMFKKPSEIQAKAITAILKKKETNIIGQAINGSGKTMAFVIPALELTNEDELIQSNQNRILPQFIIIAHSRELLTQTFKKIQELSKAREKITVGCILAQNEMYAGHIIVCTLQGLLTAVQTRKVALDKVKAIIIDEFDFFITDQSSPQYENLIKLSKLNKTVKPWNWWLFSATVDMNNPFVQEIKNNNCITLLISKEEDLRLDNVLQFVYNLNDKGTDKLDFLNDLLKNIDLAKGQVIIFSNTKSYAQVAQQYLTEKGIEADYFSGDLNKEERAKVEEKFRNNQIKVLIASDLLARGFDQRNIPNQEDSKARTYLHRVGRTGRMGDTGVALNIISNQRQETNLKDIYSHYGQEIQTFTDFKELNKIIEDAYEKTHDKRKKLGEKNYDKDDL